MGLSATGVANSLLISRATNLCVCVFVCLAMDDRTLTFAGVTS